MRPRGGQIQLPSSVTTVTKALWTQPAISHGRRTHFPRRWPKMTLWSPPYFLALILHRFQNQSVFENQRVLGVPNSCYLVTYSLVRIKHIFVGQIWIKVLFSQRIKNYQCRVKLNCKVHCCYYFSSRLNDLYKENGKTQPTNQKIPTHQPSKNPKLKPKRKKPLFQQTRQSENKCPIPYYHTKRSTQ